MRAREKMINLPQTGFSIIAKLINTDLVITAAIRRRRRRRRRR